MLGRSCAGSGRGGISSTGLEGVGCVALGLAALEAPFAAGICRLSVGMREKMGGGGIREVDKKEREKERRRRGGVC